MQSLPSAAITTLLKEFCCGSTLCLIFDQNVLWQHILTFTTSHLKQCSCMVVYFAVTTYVHTNTHTHPHTHACWLVRSFWNVTPKKLYKGWLF